MPIFSYLLVTCLKLLYNFHRTQWNNIFFIQIALVFTHQLFIEVMRRCSMFSFLSLKKSYRSQCIGTPPLLLYILSEAISQIAFRKLTLLSCQRLILDAKQNFLYYTKNSSNCATCARLSRV